MKTSDGRSTQRSAQGGVHPGKTTKTRVINFIVLIFCFIGSIALWFYVQDYDSPTYEKKFTNISVDIVGETDGYSVLSGYNNTIDVTVIGRKSDINKLYSSDIVAQIDISDITDTGTVSCPVTVILPNGISVSELSANSFWLYIDTTASMTIKVIVTHTGYTENGLIVGTAVASPATVTVSGPVGELRKIAGAYCTLDLGQISGSVSANGTLELRDSSGDAIDNPYMSI
ncbi:MAG TPA: CdaR family protein, partial [Bacillota bacterium]|nr:CdaR family protein [Bacillota bacterium]